MVRPVKPTTKDSRCQLKGQTGTLCPAMVHDPHLLMISQASQERKKKGEEHKIVTSQGRDRERHMVVVVVVVRDKRM